MTVSAVFDVVADAAPEVRAGLPGRRTETDSRNVSGEQQLAADVWADELLCERLLAVDGVGAYASEERESTVPADGDGRYAVAVDPLDGSSNLRSNNPMGIIVGVYDGDLPDADATDLVAAGFVLYGPITTMVVSRPASGDDRPAGRDPREADLAATEYVLDGDERRDVGEVALPDDPTVYGFGGRVPEWTPDFEAHVREVESELKLRYGGAMIADVNQVLTYGGIFGYPALEGRPEGKLRYFFEAAPMAHVVRAADGSSSNGERSLLDPAAAGDGLHARTPVFLGNDDLVADLEAALGD